MILLWINFYSLFSYLTSLYIQVYQHCYSSMSILSMELIRKRNEHNTQYINKRNAYKCINTCCSVVINKTATEYNKPIPSTKPVIFSNKKGSHIKSVHEHQNTLPWGGRCTAGGVWSWRCRCGSGNRLLLRVLPCVLWNFHYLGRTLHTFDKQSEWKIIKI